MNNRLFIWVRHRHHHQVQQQHHQLLQPPPQHWRDLSFCQRNCSSRGLQTTRILRALVPQCKHRLSSTYMNFGHLCQKKMPSPSGEDGRQPIHCLSHWRKILQLRLHHRPAWSGCSPSVDGWLLAAATDSLKIWRCVCFWNWTKTWCNCVIE